MDDRRALMSAILANPEEDTPRLALADWLDEHGDKHDRARAEFTRLQIDAAKLPAGDKKRNKLETAAKKLHAAHAVEWLKPLELFVGKAISFPPTEIDWTRGLLKYLLLQTGEFLQKACQKAIPEALAAVGVEHIGFYSATKKVAALAASPAFRWTASVSYPGPDDDALEAFGASAEWEHLSRIEFDTANVTDAGLEDFAHSAKQTRLRLFGCSVSGGLKKLRGKYTAAGLLAVVGSARFPLLDALDLGGDQPAKFDFTALLHSPAMKRIRTLRLGSGVEMAVVATSPSLTSVRGLAINSGRITDPDAKTLLANPDFVNLTKLEMYGMNWGHPRLSKPVENALRARFGENVLRYSPEQK